MALLAVDEPGPQVAGTILDHDGAPIEYQESPPAGEALRRLGGRIGSGIEQLGDFHADPGVRLGESTELVTRQGRREEVLTPFFVDPQRALASLASRSRSSRPVGERLALIEDVSEGDDMIVWKVRLRTLVFLRRSATLRAYPSPSANLTILELIPDRPRRIGAGAFVRSGIRSIEQLGQSMVAAARSASVGI